MVNYLSLWVCYLFLVHFIYTPCSHAVSLQIPTLAQSTLSTMAAGDASQTTPIQIAHVFMLLSSTQIVHVQI